MSVAVNFIDQCTCEVHIGMFQWLFEDLTARGLAFNDIMRGMGWGKICCRLQVMNAPRIILTDSNSSGYLEESDPGKEIVKKARSEIRPKKNPPTIPLLPGQIVSENFGQSRVQLPEIPLPMSIYGTINADGSFM